jgi:hypothetical protein
MHMTITEQDIITRLWEIANSPTSKARGTIGGRRSAFKLLLEIRGGFGFIASRPATELQGLGRRGICSPNLGTIMREIAGVELQRREKLRELAGLELETQRLLRQAVGQQEKQS